MAKEIRALLDTNILIQGARDLNSGGKTAESKILEQCEQGRVRMVISLSLLEEYLRVASRLEGKDFASGLHHAILTVYQPEFVSDALLQPLFEKFSESIPKNDLPHFLTCLVSGVEYLVSENREFLRKSSEAQKLFKCVTAEEFMKAITKDNNS